MKTNKQDIWKLIDDEYNLFTKKYGEDRILGVFAYGEANYGILDEFEIKFTTVYLPTFKEICINLQPMRVDESHSHLVDIRLSMDAGCVQSNYFIESVLTNYYKINPRYESLYEEYFRQNNKKLCELNPKKRIEFAEETGRAALYNKDYYTAARLKAAIEFYIEGVECDKCIHIYKMPYINEYLKSIIKNKNGIDIKTLEDFYNQDLTSNLPDANEEIKEILQRGIFEIMTLAVQDSVKKEKFLNSLTNKEKNALKEIIDKIGEEGNLSISALVTETKLSRPVFNNVLMKLDNFKIAEIDNKGAKGTHVKFIEKIRM